MRRIVFVLCLSTWFCGSMLAESIPIDVTVEIDDDRPEYPTREKAPRRIPRFYQDGHTIKMPNYHPEYIISIIQDCEIVYSSVIPAGVNEYEIPDYINGKCCIQFIYGRFCISGEICL